MRIFKSWRKLFIVFMLILCVSGVCFGASSDDIYVRKDVFEVYMQNINAKFDRIIEELHSQRQELQSQRQELQSQSQAINELNKSVAVMSERIDRNFETLSGRIDGLDARVSDLRNDIYLWLVVLGIVIALPSAQRFLQWRDERQIARKLPITLDEVERLIEAKLSDKLP